MVLVRQALLLALGVLVSCGGSHPAADVTLDRERRSAEVRPGAVIDVHIGQDNASIGDSWRLVDVRPDASYIAAIETIRVPDCGEPAPGCGSDLTYRVRLAEGVSSPLTFTIENCYRGACPSSDELAERQGEQDSALSERLRYELTVTD